MPPLNWKLLQTGMRLAVAVSGGADSVALLRLLAQEATRLGLVLSVVHMHHGIRGAEADQDAVFVGDLAERLGLRLLQRDVDTREAARHDGKGLEETARRLRYGWFQELLASGALDAIATAHTLNDQAETVLHKLLRGAWTEGLSGVHPVVDCGPVETTRAAAPGLSSRAPLSSASGLPGAWEGGRILRPLLGATREEIVAWLGSIGQPWREDSTNADLSYTRNRIRHQLLPELASYNPRIAVQLAHVATLAREEDEYWQREVDRLLPGLLLPGRPVRGGGRASSTLPGERSLAVELDRLRPLHPALMRRLLRGAARELGVRLDYEQTGRLLALVGEPGTATIRHEELTGELRAERTPRELRLVFSAAAGATRAGAPSGRVAPATRVEIPIPGEGELFGWRVRCSPAEPDSQQASEPAILRAALAADRVQLRYSRGAPKRIKEVLERMGVPAADRGAWPVLAWRGEIVWMGEVVLEPTAVSSLLRIEAEPPARAGDAYGAG